MAIRFNRPQYIEFNYQGIRLNEDIFGYIFINDLDDNTHTHKHNIMVKHKTDNVNECPICYESKPLAKLQCSHEICVKCLKECLKTPVTTCALCRTQITEIETDNHNDMKSYVATLPWVDISDCSNSS